MKTIVVLSSWSSGSTAISGFLDKCGSYSCPPHQITNDPRTPNAYEPLEYRNILAGIIDEFSLEPKNNLSKFQDFFSPWLLVQHSKAAAAGATSIVLKHPLQAFFIEEIVNVCNPILLVVTRPFEIIEKTRIRRRWPSTYGGQGAVKIYNQIYSFLHNNNKSYLTIAYQEFKAKKQVQDSLINYCGLQPTDAQLQAAREWLV